MYKVTFYVFKGIRYKPANKLDKGFENLIHFCELKQPHQVMSEPLEMGEKKTHTQVELTTNHTPHKNGSDSGADEIINKVNQIQSLLTQAVSPTMVHDIPSI